jgi:hypothetical protein
MGKLDTLAVNGPEGEVVDWDAVDWRLVEDDVRRLRQRIFTATQAGDLKWVRNLQRLTQPLPKPPARRSGQWTSASAVLT